VLPKMISMPLAVAREADWGYEVKWDGFRALAYIDGHQCKLVSRRGRELQVMAVSLYGACRGR
jgi:ATP-dependent DNA ligase